MIDKSVFNYPKIPPHRRELMLKIWAAYLPMHAVLQPLCFLDMHMHPEAFDLSMKWLIRNGLTGAKFVEFYQTIGGSDLELQRRLLMQLESTKEYKRLYAGKDVLV